MNNKHIIFAVILIVIFMIYIENINNKLDELKEPLEENDTREHYGAGTRLLSFASKSNRNTIITVVIVVSGIVITGGWYLYKFKPWQKYITGASATTATSTTAGSSTVAATMT